MSERKYFVLCENNCKFESMTKEQILAAITQAINEGTVGDCDTGFITRIQEQNAKGALKFWVGTQAEYNAIAEPEQGCFYIISDDSDFEDITAAIEALDKAVKSNEKEIANNAAAIQTKAPAGFGLGTDATKTYEKSLDEITKTGWYRVGANVLISPFLGYGIVLQVIAADTSIVQIAYVSANDSRHNCVARRSTTNSLSNWGEWEYENPPMAQGVEYRTTERYLGSVVYAKLIQASASAEVYNETAETYSLSVNHGISNLAFVKSISAIHKRGTSSFIDMASFGGYGLAVTAEKVEMTYDAPLTSGTVYIELKYTKG